MISYEYVYVFGGQYNLFHHLALFNLVLGLTSIFIEIQEVQMMNGIYGDMTLYSHATIQGGQPVTISIQAIYISFSTALQVYKARFYNILGTRQDKT